MRSYAYCGDDPVDCADPSGLAGQPGGELGGGADLAGTGGVPEGVAPAEEVLGPEGGVAANTDNVEPTQLTFDFTTPEATLPVTLGDGAALPQTVSSEGVSAPGTVEWVVEKTDMSARASSYQAGATGARSDIATRTSMAPRIRWVDSNGVARFTKFDGLEDNALIDRKLQRTGSSKARKYIQYQSEALSQNGYTGRWELPNQIQANAANNLFKRMGITNIIAEVAPEVLSE